MAREMVAVIDPDGTVHALWNDHLPLRELGTISVERASNVEFNPATGEWEAITPDGRMLAHGANRDEVIAGEIAAIQAGM